MSEGQFSEHLKARIDYHLSHPEGIAFSGELLKPSHVFAIFSKILDEIRKEYPLESNPKYRVPKIGFVHEGINASLLQNDRDEWFLKWHGKVLEVKERES